ncbi:MAG: DUF2075 domain-containing protein [Myxococcales bacterium]|nr:DUF2075 domain-containing protein [Myxococcales bacterium]
MARSIPAQGPRGGAHCARHEAALWSRFELGLPTDWTLVHGARWVARARPGAPLTDGAADFVLAHAERGLLVVRGLSGGLLHDPGAGGWTSLGGAAPGPIPDPFAAADAQLDALVRTLADHPAWPAGRPVLGYAVALPDILAPARGFALHAPRTFVLDRADLDHSLAAIERVLAAWAERRPPVGNAPSRQWWRAFEDLFLMPKVAHILLRHRIEDEQRQMVALSPQQFQVLDLLGRVRRLAVSGPAGTGKTVLAIHKARLLAQQGQRVLLTCFNKALGHHLRQALADEPNVTAIHFHELCAERAGLLDAAVPTRPADRTNWFDHGLAAALAAAAERSGPWFDALVVDEAQDFLAGWWEALASCCRDPARCVRYVFFDDAQRLRADAAPVPGADAAATLTTNWRNTGRIHAWLARLEPTLRDVQCAAPDGADVEVEPVRPDLAHALRRVLQRVVHEGGMAADDVVVLTGRNPGRSRVAELDHELAPIRLTLTDEPGAVRLRSIHAFKGMEAPVIILCELDGIDSERRRRLHHVGASRATNLLVVMGDAIVEPAPLEANLVEATPMQSAASAPAARAPDAK